MHDRIALALQLLDQEAPRKEVTVQVDPIDPRRRTFVVPTLEGRRQVVYAAAMPDQMSGERLDIVSLCVRELPPNPELLVGLLAIARDFRRARLCVLDRTRPQLAAVATFVPDELHEGSGQRLLHAVREVAAVADSIERQLTGADLS